MPLVEFARDNELELRFIEFMPLDAEENWASPQVLTGAKIRALIQEQFGPLIPASPLYPSQPAINYRFADGAVEFIGVTERWVDAQMWHKDDPTVCRSRVKYFPDPLGERKADKFLRQLGTMQQAINDALLALEPFDSSK